MRTVLVALAIAAASVTNALAADFECVWGNLPNDTRAAFTRNTRTADDITTVLHSGILTEPMLVAAMSPCAIDEETEAVQLGQYVAARALALAHRSRLLIQKGWHESRFALLMAPVTPADREIVWRSASGDQSVDASATAARFRTSAQEQGLSEEDFHTRGHGVYVRSDRGRAFGARHAALTR
jgi:hypothetical protein